MADNKLEFTISGDARDFIKASKEAQTAIQDLGKSAENTAESLKSSTTAGVSSVKAETSKMTPAVKQSAAAFTEVRAAALTYFTSLATSPMAAFAAGVMAVNKAMDELMEAERSAAGLMAAFSTEPTNKALEKTRDLIEDLASKSSFFDDDAISAGAVVLKNLGATQSQLETLLPVAANLAAVYGMTVPQAAEKLAYGITGSTRSLRDFGILLRDNSTAAERYAAIIDRNKKAGDQLSTMSTGVTAAMGRMNKAIGDAWQDFGDNFQDFIIGMITGIQKLVQAIAVIPTVIKLVADIAVNALGQIPIVIAGIGEGIKNLVTGKGFSMKETKTFMDAFRAQMSETTGKDFERLKKQVSDLFTFGGATPGPGGAGLPGLQGGLVPPPGDQGPPPPADKTLTQMIQESAAIKNLYGFKPDEAFRAAVNDVFKSKLAIFKAPEELYQGTSAKQMRDALIAEGKVITPELQTVLGQLAGFDMKAFTERIDEYAGQTFDNIIDPIDRLKAQMQSLQMQIAITEGGLKPTAVTGEQKQQVEDMLAQQKSQMQALNVQLVNLETQKNQQFISALGNAFNSFIQSLADTLGRAAAGGAGVSKGGLTRAVGGLAAGALAAGALMAPASATVAMGGVTLPLAGLLQVGAMLVGGLAGFFGGMLDQGDESNQHLKELVQLGREQKTDALKRMGLLSDPVAQLVKGLQPLFDQAAGKGGKLGSGMEAIIQRFGIGSINDPQARSQLETIAKGIATGSGDWAGMVNANMGLGIEMNKENRQMLENLFLTLFNLVDDFKNDQTKRDEEARQNELKQLGSMPRNPVYVYDVTPKDERFSFAPREAFFRASSTRQVGTNVTPAYQMG